MIKVRLKLKPSQRGTKKLLRKYGKKLVSVRYRYDDEKNKRAKGKWSKTIKTWQLPYKTALRLGVKSRILKAGNQ